MRVLVTGASGFLGGHIVSELLARGDSVLALVRNPERSGVAAGAELIKGDLRNPPDVHQACEEVDAVIHAAARVGPWGPYREFFDSNVKGTENLIDACQRHRVRKLVFTSTPSVAFAGEHIRDGNESLPYPGSYLCSYQKTKSLAEQLVLRANGSFLKTVALRPHAVWGAGDSHSIPRLVAAARCGLLRVVGDGQNRISMIHVIDAARAHLLALDSDLTDGKPYFVNDPEPVLLWDWYARILKALSIPPPNIHIGYRLAYCWGGIKELTHRCLPFLGEPKLTRFVAAVLAKDHYFSVANAQRDFDFQVAVSREEEFAKMIQDFQQRDSRQQ